MNIVLIGMPGCGKSTAGVVLAKFLGMHFLDSDLLIQQREQALLQKILDSRGLNAFLQAERDTLMSINCENTVIATGGSAVYSQEAMMHLKALDSTTVYLKLDYETVSARITNTETRGIAKADGATLRDIYDERSPLYEKYADITLDCRKLSGVEETVKALQAALGAKAMF